MDLEPLRDIPLMHYSEADRFPILADAERLKFHLMERYVEDPVAPLSSDRPLQRA